jgi:hypothetical protein
MGDEIPLEGNFSRFEVECHCQTHTTHTAHPTTALGLLWTRIGTSVCGVVLGICFSSAGDVSYSHTVDIHTLVHCTLHTLVHFTAHILLESIDPGCPLSCSRE